MNWFQRFTVKMNLYRFRPKLEPLMYRPELFRLLNERFLARFNGKRILEIGPKDGLDSVRLQGLNPSELVFLELPEKDEVTRDWLQRITIPHRYLRANLLYLTSEELEALGKFDLIWCTGVLYHNAEQLRFLRRLYCLAAPRAVLVVETSTTRNPNLVRHQCVEIFWPETYRHTGTITHLPSKRAVVAWLGMAGWRNIVEARCWDRYNPDLASQRFAVLAERRAAEDEGFAYYAKSGLNPKWIAGEAQ